MNRRQLVCAVIGLGIVAPIFAGTTDADPLPPASPVASRSGPPEPDANYVFGLLDRDNDSRIDSREAEASAPLTRYFGEIDTDANGIITRTEWAAYFSQTGPGA